MKPCIPAILLTCLLMVMAAVTALAQFDTAVVLGTVRDPNGAILPKATVTLKNLATGVAATAQTDSEGNYQFFNVKIGAYQVIAEAQGFARAVDENVHGDGERAPARRPYADCRRDDTKGVGAGLGCDARNRFERPRAGDHSCAIVNLPLNGRAYADLALLSPGVRKSSTSDRTATPRSTSTACAARKTTSWSTASITTPTAPPTRDFQTRWCNSARTPSRNSRSRPTTSPPNTAAPEAP